MYYPRKLEDCPQGVPPYQCCLEWKWSIIPIISPEEVRRATRIHIYMRCTVPTISNLNNHIHVEPSYFQPEAANVWTESKETQRATTAEGGAAAGTPSSRARRAPHRLRGRASGCARARVRDAPAGNKQAPRAQTGGSILGRDSESLLLPVTLPGAAAGDAAAAAAWRPSGRARGCARVCV